MLSIGQLIDNQKVCFVVDVPALVVPWSLASTSIVAQVAVANGKVIGSV